jgi:hypothetical protein
MTIKLNNYEPAIKAGAQWENPKMKLQQFVDDASAGVSGLVKGDLWQDASGVVHIKL